MPPLARSNYAAALRSMGTTLALIETAEGGSIGRAAMLLAVAGDERPVSALFATFRSFLVRFSCLGCFGAEALGLSAPRDRSRFLPTLTATIPLAQALTTLAGLAASNRDNFDSSVSISCRRSVTFARIAASTSRLRPFSLETVIVFKDMESSPRQQASPIADSRRFENPSLSFFLFVASSASNPRSALSELCVPFSSLPHASS
jgi:hypothetical protein